MTDIKDTSQEEPIAFDPVLFDLFCSEVQTQGTHLTEGLLQLEKKPSNKELLDSLMRAAHSIKGAARIMNLSLIVKLAHSIEDYFIAAQNHVLTVTSTHIDQLLKATDLLISFSKMPFKKMDEILRVQKPQIEECIQRTTALIQSKDKIEAKLNIADRLSSTISEKDKASVLRMSAQNLNRMMGLAGQSLVDSHSLEPIGHDFQRMTHLFNQLSDSFEKIQLQLSSAHENSDSLLSLSDFSDQFYALKHMFVTKQHQLDGFIQKQEALSDKLYHEIVNSRLRPFREGLFGFKRMIRDLSRELGKSVRLEIEGETTLVDRDILEKLETPLGHLLRNAVDHGIEESQKRILLGKPPEGLIKLSAFHQDGNLVVSIADDGRGVNLEVLRMRLKAKKIASEEALAQMNERELLEFIFIENISTAETISQISGRGVGLSSVQDVIKSLDGTIKVSSISGKGVQIELKLPITLSVIHSLIVSIAKELYAFALAKIDRALTLPSTAVFQENGSCYIKYGQANAQLLSMNQMLGIRKEPFEQNQSQVNNHVKVVIVNYFDNYYGLIVDDFVAEKELVIDPLDRRLGNIPGIAAASLTEEGCPLLMIDVENLLQNYKNKA